MRSFVRGMGASALGLAIVSVARADAPPAQYAGFNATDVVITDDGTGLSWQRTVVYRATSLADGEAYCAALSLGGLVGWRVPSYKELLTLVDEDPHVEYPTGAPQTDAIDPHAFPGTPVDAPFWSSSPTPMGGSAYVVRFDTGEALTATVGTPSYYVRCVR
jgi:hypothetical protein